MKRLALALALAALAVLAPPAVSQEHLAPAARSVQRATIGFAAFTPARLHAVTDATVTWTNDSARTQHGHRRRRKL